MRGIQGFFAGSEKVSPQDLQAYVDALQLGADYAGLADIAVIEPALAVQQLDIDADGVRRAAMNSARDSGRLTMTGKLKLASSTGVPAQASFVLFLALYQGGGRPATMAERRTGLRGWVMVPVRMNELMASLYGQRALVNDVRIHEGVQMSDETLMFDSDLGALAPEDSALELTEYLVLAGRTWAVTVGSRGNTAVTAGQDSSNLMALGGAGMTLLLTLLAWVLATARARAMAAATAMTAELRQVKERFELIFDISPDAVVLARWTDGIVVDANKRFSLVTGFERAELLGRRMADIPLWADPVAHQKFVNEVAEKGSCENFEASFLSKDGRPHIGLVSGKKFLIGAIPHVITISRDISERKEIELRMTHMAQHDPLTGLPNRALFFDRMQQELAHAKREHTRLALMFLDLDRFKPVNDTLGHGVGDLLLKEVALRVTQCVRESDTVGRIGGDEFVVLLPLIKDDQDVLAVALKIRQVLEQPFTLLGRHTVHISCSTGIATYPEHGADEIELSKNADSAMYLAKDRGRNRTELFSPAGLGR